MGLKFPVSFFLPPLIIALDSKEIMPRVNFFRTPRKSNVAETDAGLLGYFKNLAS
jgi:hypothetical protein